MSAAKPTSSRLASLDQFRGYTVLGMFFVNFIGGYLVFTSVPFLRVFKHWNTYCSYADTIMPQFFFAVGFAYRLTFLRRLKEDGAALASWRAIKRSLGLILIGIIMYHLEGRVTKWEELQQLGFQGVMRQAFQRGPFETLVHIGVTALWILPVIGAGVSVRIAFLAFTTALSLILWHADFYRWAVGMVGLDYEQLRQMLPIFPYYDWSMTRRVIDGGPLGFMNWAIPTLVGSLAYDAVMADPPSPERGAGRLVRKLMIWGVVLMVLGYGISCLNRVFPPNRVVRTEEHHPADTRRGGARLPQESPSYPASSADARRGGTTLPQPSSPDPGRVRTATASEKEPAMEQDGFMSYLAPPPFVPPPEGTINVWTMIQRCASVSYMTFSAGLSLFLYALFVVVSDVHGFQIGLLRTLGVNALAGYIIHGMVGSAIYPYAPKDSPLWYALAAFGVDLAVIYIVCRYLEKNKLFLRL